MPRHIYPSDHIVCHCARCRDRRFYNIARCTVYRYIKKQQMLSLSPIAQQEARIRWRERQERAQ